MDYYVCRSKKSWVVATLLQKMEFGTTRPPANFLERLTDATRGVIYARTGLYV
jgi:hypothetical protein